MFGLIKQILDIGLIKKTVENKSKIYPYFLILIIGLFISNLVIAQNPSSRKQVEDPSMLTKLQGTWMRVTPGQSFWYKVKITDKVCKVWMSTPSAGHWNDGASANDPTICDITGCYKITDRNEYDGKLQSESLAFTVRRNSGNEGYTLNLHQSEGKTYLRIMDKWSNRWIVLKKVSSNYSPWD
jgi:hypothetical protein